MRNIIATFVVALGIVFFIVILPASLDKQISLSQQMNNGRVLGVSEAMADEYLEKLLKNIPVLPQNSNMKQKEEIKNEPPYPSPKNDFSELVMNNSYCAVMDTKTGDFLYESQSEKQVPIASITKLATALTFIDNNPGWENEIEIITSDLVGGGQIYLRVGEAVRVKDLFNLSLVASANSATKALVRAAGINENEFIARMNLKAKELNLLKTIFADPIGLSNANVSTAREIAILAKHALSNLKIHNATVQENYDFRTIGGRNVNVLSTDKLLKKYPENNIDLYGGKTGYTKLAGYCFAGKFSDDDGNELISVVLGDKDSNSRFYNTEKLISWVYNNFEWN